MKLYLLLAPIAIATGNFFLGQNSPDSGASEKYPPEFVRDYSQECIQTSISEGLTEAEADKLCQCTIDKFQQQYTLQEFKQLTIASSSDPTSQDALIETGQVCFEELLYE